MSGSFSGDFWLDGIATPRGETGVRTVSIFDAAIDALPASVRAEPAAVTTGIFDGAYDWPSGMRHPVAPSPLPPAVADNVGVICARFRDEAMLALKYIEFCNDDVEMFIKACNQICEEMGVAYDAIAAIADMAAGSPAEAMFLSVARPVLDRCRIEAARRKPAIVKRICDQFEQAQWAGDASATAAFRRGAPPMWLELGIDLNAENRWRWVTRP